MQNGPSPASLGRLEEVNLGRYYGLRLLILDNLIQPRSECHDASILSVLKY